MQQNVSVDYVEITVNTNEHTMEKKNSNSWNKTMWSGHILLTKPPSKELQIPKW